jgi:hypothetical protein
MKPRILITLLFIVSLSQYSVTLMAQCNAPGLVFHGPVLISGINKQVGSIYKFSNVITGVDAHIEIMDLHGGATLNNIDDSTGIGYYDAFQPYVGAGANDTSYLEWRIVFKKSGTSIDTSLACVAITGVDVDGDGSALKEFIEAETPGSIGVDPFTNLSVTFDGVRSKAISPVANIALIDTAHHEAMFQMNFTNINRLTYRNGAITTGGAQVRQTCIYFRPFFQSYVVLPVKLISFTANQANNSVQIKWSASDEENLKNYTVQRSENGRTWQNISNVSVLASNITSNYLVNDYMPLNGTTYYRLMKADKNSGISYSSIVTISPAQSSFQSFRHSTVFNNNIRLQINALTNEEYKLSLYSLNGSVLVKKRSMIHSGSNTILMDAPSSITPGVYLLIIKNSNDQELYHSRLVKGN